MPSSVIKSYVYHRSKKILTITFVSGAVYDYLQVPASIYNTMRQASSKGIFFNENIKDQFDFALIKDADI